MNPAAIKHIPKAIWLCKRFKPFWSWYFKPVKGILKKVEMIIATLSITQVETKQERMDLGRSKSP